MFEQSYINQAPAEPVTEGDFLYDYEIRSWQLSPRIYKILGASLVVNLVLLAVFAQTPILTAKGCDSPLVGRVCQVLDTVYVGSLLFGTDREYVDVAYERTSLADADITFVDVSNLEAPLEYPAGYFQIANPEQQFASLDQSTPNGFIEPGIPANPTTVPPLINTPQVLPTPNANAVEGDLPTFDNPTTTTPRKSRRGGRVNSKPNNSSVASTDTNTNSNPTVPNANTQDPNQTAPQDEAKADQFGVYINKRPTKDLAGETLKLLEANPPKIKLDAPFKVTIAGTLGLGKDGKTVVLKNPVPVPDKTRPNDPAMEKFVQDWILAVGDAGWFGYLDKLKSKKVVITIEQNDTEIIANVRADQPTVNDANTVASGLRTLIGFAVDKASGDEQTFLKLAEVTSDGKAFILNFRIPKQEAQDMIQRKLAESKQPQQPNGNAGIRPNNSSAAK